MTKRLQKIVMRVNTRLQIRKSNQPHNKQYPKILKIALIWKKKNFKKINNNLKEFKTNLKNQ